MDNNYKTNLNNITDLILLVGTSPLPNYITGYYFLENAKNLKKIWLMYSENRENQNTTKGFAEELAKLLYDANINNKLNENVEIIYEGLGINHIGKESHVRETCSKLKSNIFQKNPNAVVHLNYTGGSKCMSTLSYDVFKNLEKFSSSYLDTRSYQLIFSNDSETEDLRSIVPMTLEKIIELHNYVFYVENKERKIEYLEALKIIDDEIIQKNKLKDYFGKNKNGFLTKFFTDEEGNLAKFIVFDDNNRKFKKYVSKRNIDKLMQIQIDDTLQKVFDSFPIKIFKYNKLNEEIEGQDISKIIDFLDGRWLEEYVFNLIQNNTKINEIVTSKHLGYEFIKKDHLNDPNKRFEIDIILLKGYQLFGISCTTIRTKGLCKSKGFEIIQRTRQIGGNETKNILITFLEYDNKNSLQDELFIDTGLNTKNILVLGIEDINKDILLPKIIDFVSQTNKNNSLN